MLPPHIPTYLHNCCAQVTSIYLKLHLAVQRKTYAADETEVLGGSVEPVVSVPAATEQFTADGER